MENASKALIIAGAILIAIVLITLGVIILGQGQEVAQNANMSETEIATFNAKFTQFEGTNVRGSNVKQLYKTVLQHNLAQNDEGKKVSITATAESGNNATPSISSLSKTATGFTTTSGNSTTTVKTGDSGKTYTVTCNYSNTTGLVTDIAVKVK